MLKKYWWFFLGLIGVAAYFYIKRSKDSDLGPGQMAIDYQPDEPTKNYLMNVDFQEGSLKYPVRSRAPSSEQREPQMQESVYDDDLNDYENEDIVDATWAEEPSQEGYGNNNFRAGKVVETYTGYGRPVDDFERKNNRRIRA